MNFHGLVGVLRKRLLTGTMQYVLVADADFAVGRPRTTDKRFPYGLAEEGLLIRGLATIRRGYPYLFLLTNDTPEDTEAETHLDVHGGLYDKAFMERFPHATVHINLGRHDEFERFFSFGPKIYSRVFNIGREEITFLWDGLLNKAMPPVDYQMLYCSRKTPLSKVADAIEGCRSREEFDSRVLKVVNLIAWVLESPGLFLFTRDDRVMREVEGGATWERPAARNSNG